MASQMTVQLGRRGVVTLPKHVRDAYHLKPGEVLTLVDLDGVLLLRPGRASQALVAQVAEHGESLEPLLALLRDDHEPVAAGRGRWTVRAVG